MQKNNQSVVIIGAGVIGLATAYELLKRGLKVTIVEEKEPGWAASHGNAGMIYPAAGEPMINPHHMKAGMRACTPDGLPAIGKLPCLENAWIGSGHWHFGLTLAPSTAVMLAELITTGKSAVNSKPFDPARF